MENKNSRRENGFNAFSRLHKFLKSDGRSPKQIEERQVYWFRYNSKKEQFLCYAEIIINQNLFVFYIVNPDNVPKKSRVLVSELLTRLNWGMYIGNFELDYDDGQIRFKSSLDFKDEMLTDNLIRGVIYTSIRMMDTHKLFINSVLQGHRTPLEVINELEEIGKRNE